MIARAAVLTFAAAAIAACSQPLKLMKDDSAEGLSHSGHHPAESRPIAAHSR